MSYKREFTSQPTEEEHAAAMEVLRRADHPSPAAAELALLTAECQRVEERIKAAMRFVVMPYCHDEYGSECHYPMKVGPFDTRDEAEKTAKRLPFEHYRIESMLPLEAYCECYRDTRVSPAAPGEPREP